MRSEDRLIETEINSPHERQHKAKPAYCTSTKPSVEMVESSDIRGKGQKKPAFSFLSDDPNICIVIFILLLCILLFLICCMICCCCLKRRKRKRCCNPGCGSLSAGSDGEAVKKPWLGKVGKNLEGKRSNESRKGTRRDKKSYEDLSGNKPYCQPYYKDNLGKGSHTSWRSRSGGQDPIDCESMINYELKNERKSKKSHKDNKKVAKKVSREMQKDDSQEATNEDYMKSTKSKHHKSSKDKKKDSDKLQHKHVYDRKKKHEDEGLNEKSVVLTFKLGLPRNQKTEEYYAPYCESPHKKLVLTDSSTDVNWQDTQTDKKDVKIIHQNAKTKFTTQNGSVPMNTGEMTPFLYKENMRAERLAEGDGECELFSAPRTLTQNDITKIGTSAFQNRPSPNYTQTSQNFNTQIQKQHTNFISKIPELSTKQNYRSYQTIPEKLSNDINDTNKNQEMVTIQIHDVDVFGKDSLEILSELKELDQSNCAAEKESCSYTLKKNSDENNSKNFTKYQIEANCYNK